MSGWLHKLEDEMFKVVRAINYSVPRGGILPSDLT